MGDWSIESNRKGQNREVKGHKETEFRREKNNMKMRKKRTLPEKGSRRKRKRRSPKCGQTQTNEEREDGKRPFTETRDRRGGRGTHTQK